MAVRSSRTPTVPLRRFESLDSIVERAVGGVADSHDEDDVRHASEKCHWRHLQPRPGIDYE